MNLFGNKGQERATQSLIHDTNSAFFNMTFHIQKLEKIIKKLAPVLSESESNNELSSLFILVEYFKSDEKKLKEVIDNYYTKFKEDFPEAK